MGKMVSRYIYFFMPDRISFNTLFIFNENAVGEQSRFCLAPYMREVCKENTFLRAKEIHRESPNLSQKATSGTSRRILD